MIDKKCHDHGTCCHHEENKKLFVIRLVISGLLWIFGNYLFTNQYQFVCFIVAYVIIGYDVLFRALKSLLKLEFTNEQLLMSLVSLASIILNETEEAVMVMFLYQLGEFLSDLAVDKSKESIAKLLENDDFDEQPNQSKTESMVDKFAHIYTPTVIFLAVMVLIISLLFFKKNFHESLSLACTMLAISCPCALVISIPLAYYCGMGNAYYKKIIIRNAQVLENIAKREKVEIHYLDSSENKTVISDVLVLDKNISKQEVERICNKTMRIVKENLCFIIFSKLTFLFLSAIGRVTMFLAVFADVGVTIITVLNSSRARLNVLK